MTITLRKEALDYYILSSLSIQDLYEVQILQNVVPYININHADFFKALNMLERRGMITKERFQKDALTHYNLCSITPLGKDCVEALEQELDFRLSQYR